VLLGAVLASVTVALGLNLPPIRTLPESSSFVVATPEPRPDGRQLYEVHCSSCHGTLGQGSPVAPPMIEVGKGAVDFMLSTGRMPASVPQAQSQRQPPIFSSAQTNAIVDYVASLTPGSAGRVAIPNVDPDAGDLARGRTVYGQNCAACHGAAAQGAAVGYGEYAPALDRATPTQIGEAIRLGPNVMPHFGPQTISDADMNSIARYVLWLRHPENRGGASLGYEGPVPEGFIGFVGLGSILLVARFVGTKT